MEEVSLPEKHLLFQVLQVKVAGWSCSPTTFSEEELYKRAKIVLSVLNKLETDLLHKNVEELFGATDDE